MSERLQKLDERWSARARVEQEPGLWRTLSGILAHSGDSWFWILGLVVLWLAGNAFWKERALVMLVGIAVTAIIVMIAKFTIRRRRPEGDWGGIYRKTDPHSFPSGHAARGAALATIALVLEPLWFGIALVVWAPLMAFSRVRMGLHYVTDILGGAIFGVVIGFLVARFF